MRCDDCFTVQAWIAASSRPHARSLRVVQVGSRLEKSSQLGRDNARQIEQQAMCSGNNKIGVTSGQAYSDSKRALLLYTAHIADIYEGVQYTTAPYFVPSRVRYF
jgi:hypothetical protein